VAGDQAVRERFLELRREILRRPRDPARLRTEVREMRERMRRNLSRDTKTDFDLKQGVGGIADVEFMVQYAALRWANRLGDYLDYTDNIRLLDGCDKTGLMESRDVRSLTDAYRGYRARMHQNALHEFPGVVPHDEFSEHREAVSRIWRELMGA
jgi:glutamate-ammonia-ligase adenylyltransferase